MPPLFLEESRLREVLAEVAGPDGKVEIWVDGSRFQARVISPRFRRKSDGLRQEMIYEALLTKLDEAQQRRVEFVDTETPEECARALKREAARKAKEAKKRPKKAPASRARLASRSKDSSARR